MVGLDLGGFGSIGTFLDLDVGELVAGGVNEEPSGEGIVVNDDVLDIYEPGLCIILLFPFGVDDKMDCGCL